MAKASDYRKAGRYYQQDKARRERRKAVEAAEQAYEAARDAFADGAADEPRTGDDTDRPLWAAYRDARDRLYDLDPRNHYFT